MIVRRIVVLMIAAALCAAVVLFRRRGDEESVAPSAAVERRAQPAPSPPREPPVALPVRDEVPPKLPAPAATASTPADDSAFELVAEDDGRHWADLFSLFVKGDVEKCVGDEWFVAFANPEHRTIPTDEMAAILERHRGDIERILALEKETDREQKAAVQRRIDGGFAQPMIKTAGGRQSVPPQTKRGMTSVIQIGPNEYNYVTLSEGDDARFDATVKIERDASRDLVRALRTEIRGWRAEERR